MRIARVEARPYRLPLVEPVRIRGQLLTAREGWLVRVESAAGAVGWGDAAPLPGLSRESMDQVQQELAAASESLPGRDVGRLEDLPDLWRVARAEASATRFAVETAVSNAAASETGQTLAEWLTGAQAPRCVVNALVDGDPASWPDQVRTCAAQGFTLIKIKVARFPYAYEAARLREAADAAPHVRFRLDANQSWSPLIALAFAREVEGLPIDYIEEPVRAHEPIPTAWPESIGVAWDETLQGDGPIPAPPPVVCAWILKPTLLGGLARSVALARQATSTGRSAVFSAAYESGVGIRAVMEMAASLGAVAGVDTYRALASDVLEPRLDLRGGSVDLATLWRGEVRL